MARVELCAIGKRYPNGFVAVEAFDLDIRDGEFIVLVGPSGCGKSTTLRMVAGLESISTGEVRIDGRRVNELPPKARDVAMVFQSYALYPHMTVFENMAFALTIAKVPRDEIRRRVEEAAERLGITALLDRRPKEMSGGQRQRVAMGRAIVRRPRVFLFDEPLSNLDASLRLKMRVEVSRLHRSLGATSLYVTHDQVEAMTLADRIVLLKDGKVQQIGTPMELYAQPANRFVATFVGSPAMNLWPAEGAALPGGLVALRGPGGLRLEIAAGGDALGALEVGVRPEHLRLSAGERPGALPVVVELIEPLGAESYVHGRSGERTLVARVEGRPDCAVGDTVHLCPDPSHLHLFDAQTGARR